MVNLKRALESFAVDHEVEGVLRFVSDTGDTQESTILFRAPDILELSVQAEADESGETAQGPQIVYIVSEESVRFRTDDTEQSIEGPYSIGLDLYRLLDPRIYVGLAGAAKEITGVPEFEGSGNLLLEIPYAIKDLPLRLSNLMNEDVLAVEHLIETELDKTIDSDISESSQIAIRTQLTGDSKEWIGDASRPRTIRFVVSPDNQIVSFTEPDIADLLYKKDDGERMVIVDTLKRPTKAIS